MTETRSKIYALAVIAHPDDESYLIAGTSLKFNAEGKPLVVVCATRGEQGNSQLTEPMTKRELAKVREQELRLSCAMLKVKDVDFFNFPDGGLKLAERSDIVSALIKKIDYYQPEVIITFGKEGITGHSDHIVIGEATVKAVKNSKHRPKQIWRLSLPQSIIADFEAMITKSRAHKTHYRRSVLKGVPDKKLLWLNIKKYRKQKMEAIMSHKSQGLPHWIRHKSPTMEKVFLSSEFFEVIKIK